MQKGNRFVRSNSVVWLPRGPQGEPTGQFEGIRVYGSDAGEEVGLGEGEIARTVPAENGTIETNLILVETGDTYTAFPTSTTKVVELPGYREPITMTWDENTNDNRKGRSKVVCVLKDERFPADIPTFPGDFQHFDSITPDPRRSSPWPEEPKPNDQTECWIGYIVSSKNGSLVGYAYPVKVKDPEESSQSKLIDCYELPGGTILIPGPDSNIEVQEEADDVITIIIRPVLKKPI